MKKILFASILLPLFASVYAQPIITNSIFPVAGDIYENAMDMDGAPATVTAPGPFQYWNFQGLSNDQTTSDTIFAASGNPGFADFPTSDVMIPLLGFDFFADVTNARVNLLGTGFNLMGSSFPFSFQNPIVYQIAPINYGFNNSYDAAGYFTLSTSTIPFLDNLLDSIIGSVSPIPGVGVDSLRFGLNINSDFNADAYGHVELPSGSYDDVLRIKRNNYSNTVIEAYASLGTFIGFWVDVTNFIPAGTLPIPLGSDTLSVYEFRSMLVKEPVVMLNLNPTDNSVVSAQHRAAPSPLGVQEIQNRSKMISVFPNPTGGELNIDASALAVENYDVNVVNAMGQQVAQLGKINGGSKTSFDVQSLASGYYWIQLVNTAGETTAVKVFQKK